MKWVGHDGGARARDRDRRRVIARVRPTRPAREVEAAGGKGASLARMAALGLPVPPRLRRAGGRPRRDAARLRRRRPAARAAGRGCSDAELAAAAEEARGARPRRAARARASRPRWPRRYAGARRRHARGRALERRGGGLRRRELRRPAGHVPARARRRPRDDRACATAGRRSSASARSSTAAARAASATCAWRSSCSAWSSPTWPASCSRSTPSARRKDQMVVEAAFGLGESVVAGVVTPDHYVLARDGRLKAKSIAVQPYAVVRGAGRRHGRARRSTPTRAAAQTLTEDDLRRLAELGRTPRGGARRPAGRRVGPRRRRALPAAVAAGDDVTRLDDISPQLETVAMDWARAEHPHALHLERALHWLVAARARRVRARCASPRCCTTSSAPTPIRTRRTTGRAQWDQDAYVRYHETRCAQFLAAWLIEHRADPTVARDAVELVAVPRGGRLARGRPAAGGRLALVHRDHDAAHHAAGSRAARPPARARWPSSSTCTTACCVPRARELGRPLIEAAMAECSAA